jgi:hypothetical protein
MPRIGNTFNERDLFSTDSFCGTQSNPAVSQQKIKERQPPIAKPKKVSLCLVCQIKQNCRILVCHTYLYPSKIVRSKI